LLDSQDFDALMIIHSPSAVAPGSESARALIEAVRNHPRGKYVTLLTNWCGEFSSQEARRCSAKPGCQPTARRKAPSPHLCIWWNIAATRNSCAKRRRYRVI
jgi:acetyltransferase